MLNNTFQRISYNIYTSIIYENIYFINIEGKFSGKNSDERCIIIDEDLCLIEID